MRMITDELGGLSSADGAVGQINTRAVQVIERVQQKLTGRDFKPNVQLSVDAQVDRLIAQATSLEALSQMFIGWCSFW
jgi:FKBP12-rapamycin complex-associated protein